MLGEASVMVIDASSATVDRASPVTDAVILLGAVGHEVHILLPGDSFDLGNWSPLPPSAAVAKQVR